MSLVRCPDYLPEGIFQASRYEVLGEAMLHFAEAVEDFWDLSVSVTIECRLSGTALSGRKRPKSGAKRMRWPENPYRLEVLK